MEALDPRRLRGARGLAAAIALVAGLPSTATGAEIQLATGTGNSSHLRITSWSEIPFRSVVRQQYDFSCGSAAVATLLTFHYGRMTPERQIFSAMWAVGDQPTIRKFGFSMLDIKHYLDGIGYKAVGFRLSLDQLRKTEVPGIVILNLRGYKHFVVVKGVGRNGILIGDPMTGLRRYALDEFQSHWNGIFLKIVDNPDKQPPRFNLASEWRPWSTAPLRDGVPRPGISRITNSLPPYYQITPRVTLNAGTAGDQ